MAKVKMTDHGVVHWCPGCRDFHIIYTEAFAPRSRARWVWDGNIASPTVTPSVQIKYGPEESPTSVCYYFLRRGKLIFQQESTHALAGQTVDLPDLPEGVDDAPTLEMQS